MVLITSDPMLEIAVHHLFGGEQQCFELRTTLSFSALENGVNWTGVQAILADISLPTDLEKLSALRQRTSGIPLLCWCSIPMLEMADTLRGRCDGVISRMASQNDLLSTLSTLVDTRSPQKKTSDTREMEIRLTYRESQLMTLLAQGYRNKEIAECLGIKTGTVKVYLSTLFKKTGAKDRFELSLFGIKNSLYGRAERSAPIPALVAAKRNISRPLLASIRLLHSAETLPTSSLYRGRVENVC